MADHQAPVIVIRKKRRNTGHSGGGHGGAWKVAYADFVTAMMSFFLLLWLLNVTTDIQRKGIADYFSPASISKSDSGAGGVFGGQTITSDGAQISQYTPPTVDEVTMPTAGQGDEGDADTKGKDENGNSAKSQAANDNGASAGAAGQNSGAPAAGAASALSKNDQAMAAAMQKEEDSFKQAEDVLKSAIMESPELRDFANQIVIDRTPEGLRIQIIDRDKFSMFPSGGSVPYERGRDLMRLVGKVIARLPNNISVTGHTDSNPFSIGSSRDNWSLSSERANTSREILEEAGVTANRIARVVGLADRDPFTPGNPRDPQNRRISIVLLRQAIPPADTGNAPAK